MSLSALDHHYMARALQLAERGRCSTTPNPRVGCVIVSVSGAESRVLGEGWHYQAGDPHAEIYALMAAGDEARGATVYVTLEPCSHTGKTGPCADALVKAGVARVVYGMQDPNPAVAGRGLGRLRDAGIEVDGPLMEKQAQALNPGFIRRMQHGRPWVRCKLAMSLDGRTAMQSGESQWITGKAARADVQQWRAQSCAIITGIGSIQHDNSRLTVRDEYHIPSENVPAGVKPRWPSPIRVVLDSQLAIESTAALLKQSDLVIVFTSEAAAKSQQDKIQDLSGQYPALSIVPIANSAAGLDLSAVLDYLSQHHQCNEVMVEAGARLSGAFWREGLIDELIVYQAPVLLGSEARPLLELSLTEMSQKHELQIMDQRQVGDDWRIIITPKNND